ncbi:12655_t:CDS:2 [Funneliformis geosporum]|uniref:12655_t:CDS:1 n=1 Tax=Funneliformis geosporum TaxID=1117311 RepID=A0A9W4T2W6_9GLOM|nr:12655_t:CDS:2 [Funneliformis geosporum]
MPSPNPVTFTKTTSTNQQFNSKLIYRRSSGLPEEVEDFGYSIRSHQQDESSKSSFRKWLVKKFDQLKPSLVLENKASVARDHLANERTFLAWLRTSLSFIGIGVAVTQLFRLKGDTNKGGNVIGIVFIMLGIVFLGFGITRYFHSQYLMTTGHFPASRGSVLVGTILTILSLAACFLVIVIDR